MQTDVKMINLTAHDIDFLDEDNNIIKSIRKTIEIRCESKTKIVSYINDIPITNTFFDIVDTNMPEPKTNHIYIVSRIVFNALKDHRNDIYYPNEMVRDRQKNTILGCKSLSNN